MLQKLLTFFAAKNINVFAIFQDRNFNITLPNNLVKFLTTGPRMTNSMDPDWTTCYKRSYLDLHCLQKVSVLV